MTKTYSNDLRQRVIEYLDSGNTYDETSKLFKISVSAIGGWYRKYKTEGNYNPKIRCSSKRRIDLDAFEEYIKLNKDMILKEAAENFNC